MSSYLRSAAWLLSVVATLALAGTADEDACSRGQAICNLEPPLDETALIQANLHVSRSIGSLEGKRAAPALHLVQETNRAAQVQVPLSDFFKASSAAAAGGMGGDGMGGDGGGPDALVGADAMADVGPSADTMKAGADFGQPDGPGSASAGDGDGGAEAAMAAGNPDLMAAMGMMGDGDGAAMAAMGGQMGGDGAAAMAAMGGQMGGAAMGMPGMAPAAPAAVATPAPQSQPFVATTVAPAVMESSGNSGQYKDDASDMGNAIDSMDAFNADNISLSDDQNDAAAETAEDFADLQAESMDAQDLEIENLKDAGEDMEDGCVNGGTPCADASTEPDNPFDARDADSDADGVGNSGSLDIPSVLRRVEKRATLIMERLVKQRGAQLSAIETAKDEYRTARKAGEKNHFDKMAALDKKSADQKKAARAKRDSSKAHMEEKYGNDWQQRQARGAIRNNMTVARRSIRASRLAKKKQLRSDRRKKRMAAELLLKSSLAKYMLFSKKLSKARFKRNLLPKIRKLMTAEIQGNLTLLDLAGGQEEALAAQRVVNDRSFLGLKDAESVRFYLNSRVRAQVLAPLTAHFKELRRGLWGNLDHIRTATSAQLMSSIGSVPFVGEMLSASVPSTVDDVYDTIRHAINTSMTHVHDNIAVKLTEAIANPIMDIVMPKLRMNSSISLITLPKEEELADMGKQSKLLETRSILSNWGNGLEQARAEGATQLAAILKDAEEEAKEVASDLKAENALKIEVLETP